jgi:serine/threonine-protein kinase
MATVYLAQDLKHQRQVAIKVLLADVAAAVGAERFQREIEFAARLQHPHILALYDSGEADGFLYYVMPYVEGPTLRARMVAEGQLPIAEVVRILRDVVDGVAAAHAQGVVHRDLKPENIMLPGRHALVVDFGVAKALSEASGDERFTSAGVTLGTAAYMAPEQAAGDAQADHRSDIYALGIIAYELLTGSPPFVRATKRAVLAAHLTEAPVPVGERREGVPPLLALLVMRCLAKEPADRPQRAEDLLVVLEGLATPSAGMTPVDVKPVTTAKCAAASHACGPSLQRSGRGYGGGVGILAGPGCTSVGGAGRGAPFWCAARIQSCRDSASTSRTSSRRPWKATTSPRRSPTGPRCRARSSRGGWVHEH